MTTLPQEQNGSNQFVYQVSPDKLQNQTEKQFSLPSPAGVKENQVNENVVAEQNSLGITAQFQPLKQSQNLFGGGLSNLQMPVFNRDISAPQIPLMNFSNSAGFYVNNNAQNNIHSRQSSASDSSIDFEKMIAELQKHCPVSNKTCVNGNEDSNVQANDLSHIIQRSASAPGSNEESLPFTPSPPKKYNINSANFIIPGTQNSGNTRYDAGFRSDLGDSKPNHTEWVIPNGIDLNPLDLGQFLGQFSSVSLNSNFQTEEVSNARNTSNSIDQNLTGSLTASSSIPDMTGMLGATEQWRNVYITPHKKNTWPIQAKFKINQTKPLGTQSGQFPTAIQNYGKYEERSMELHQHQNSGQMRSKKLCREFMEQGYCENGADCYYSHFAKPSDQRRRVTNYKTKPCVDPARGIQCQYQEKCNFAHPGEAIRRPMPIEHIDEQYIWLLLRDCPKHKYPYGIFV